MTNHRGNPTDPISKQHNSKGDFPYHNRGQVTSSMNATKSFIYFFFLAFVISVTFVAFNVLVGLTVDDIRKLQGNADLRKMSMRLEFIRQVEQANFQEERGP